MAVCDPAMAYSSLAPTCSCWPGRPDRRRVEPCRHDGLSAVWTTVEIECGVDFTVLVLQYNMYPRTQLRHPRIGETPLYLANVCNAPEVRQVRIDWSDRFRFYDPSTTPYLRSRLWDHSYSALRR